MSTNLSEIVYQWLKLAQFTLLPGCCIVCHRPSQRHQDLCLSCEQRFLPVILPCRQCGLPLPPGYTADRCGTCLVFPPPYRRLISPFAYSPPVSGLIGRFKYQGRLVCGKELTALLATHLKQVYGNTPMPDFLLPMPLHWRRCAARGFNQAAEISRQLSKSLGIPELRRTLQRGRATSHQTGLSAKQRQRNIRGAFQLRKGMVVPPCASIALIDDVVTTGATIGEVSETLRNSGASSVEVWTLARTIV